MSRRATPLDTTREPYASLLAALLHYPGATRQRLALATGLTYSQATRAAERLTHHQPATITRAGRGGRRDPFSYVRNDWGQP